MVIFDTYRQVLTTGEKALEQAQIEDAAFNARELLGKAAKTDCRCAEFSAMLERQAEQAVTDSFLSLCERRANGEPLQYILGEWDFYDLRFKVGQGVLIPRQDTETLVDIVIEKYKNSDNLILLDLCAGSGCIGLTLEKHLNCQKVCCVERSESALKYLYENKRLNSSCAEIVCGDVLEESTLEKLPTADLIVCNPPYLTSEDMQDLQKEVRREPEEALFGGEDGLDFYRAVTRLWKNKLKDGGMLIYEIGMGQEDEVMLMLVRHGFENVRARKDMRGINRCVFGFKKAES